MAYRTTPKMAQRKEAHRAHLLEVAVRLFGKRGYHATTVPMIVKASGGSTGSFYFYFRNKEDVFAAALEEFGREGVPARHPALPDDVAEQRLVELDDDLDCHRSASRGARPFPCRIP